MSEVDINNDWETDALINLAEYYNGAAFKPKDWGEEGLPIIRIEQLNRVDSNKDYFSGFLLPKHHINDGDLIFSWSATLKVIIWTRGEGALNQHLYKVVPKQKINILLLLHLIDFNMEKLAGLSQGSTMKHVTRKELSGFHVTFPSNKLEQKKIATILQTIDQVIEKTEALIEKYQQIKAGLMYDLFSRGITADGKLRPPREQAPELYQETPIGWIPKDWEAKSLEIILLESGGYLQTGPFGSQLHAHEYTFEGIPVVMPQNINHGNIDTEEIARINESRAKSLNRHRLKLGDIIISRRGELNRAAAIKEKDIGFVCGTGCFLLRLTVSDLDANFFSLIYSHNIIQRQVVGLAVGSTMPSLNNGIMNKLIFPNMDLEEQNRISDRLEIIESKIDGLVVHARKLSKQKQGLMQDLLTGKVLVKVDNPEASHEK